MPTVHNLSDYGAKTNSVRPRIAKMKAFFPPGFSVPVVPAMGVAVICRLKIQILSGMDKYGIDSMDDSNFCK